MLNDRGTVDAVETEPLGGKTRGDLQDLQNASLTPVLILVRLSGIIHEYNKCPSLAFPPNAILIYSLILLGSCNVL